MKVRGRPLNPVLARELRQRMRTRWAPLVLTLYLGLLVAILQIVYSAAEREVNQPFGFGVLAGASVGRAVFETLLFFVLLLLCFVVPGLTAGAIAGERERQTLVPLQVTLLSPTSILAGKLFASLAFVVLLVIATLPLLGVAFVLGGVSLGEAVRGLAMVLAVGVTLASLSLACSTLLRRVQVATVAAYGLTLFLLVGTFMVFGAQVALGNRVDGDEESKAMLVINPLVATADVVAGTEGAERVLPSPFRPFRQMARDEHTIVERTQVTVVGRPEGGVVIEQPGRVQGRFVGGPEQVPLFPAGDPRLRTRGTAVWPRSLAAWAVLSALSLVVAARRLRVPSNGAGT